MTDSASISGPTRRSSRANLRQFERLAQLIESAKDQCLVAGFNGEIHLRIMVGDGTAQDVLKTVITKER